MRYIISLSISIFSIIIGLVIIIGGYFFYGKQGFFEGVPAWILGTVGAPTTFLCWIVGKIGLSKSIISQYVWLYFFYLLQYQIIAILIYRGVINLSSRRGVVYTIIILGTILISAKIMWNIIMGYWILKK